MLSACHVGRYKSPNEHPFFLDDLPDPMLPPLQYPQVLHPIAGAININNKIWDMYFRDLLTRLVREGDDVNCGSAAVCDTICLQDRTRLMDLLTYPTVEEAIKSSVEMKAKAYGKEVIDNNNVEEDGADPVGPECRFSRIKVVTHSMSRCDLRGIFGCSKPLPSE
ncbi:hypothetical protein HYC85_025642 [Camellia sinensis]|uniref:chorismate mutase n=1 Tax=Camellia sinensis TaxID=4442 RepID=A0A7J7GFK9_CAMSI|nr:hypothetical protein HYC85_025642 [Camellia sinensis]